MRQTVELYADDGGTGDRLPVVFLHSWAGNASQWSAQLEHLRPHQRAVALEWRGHGRSGSPADGDFSIPAIAADVQAAVDRLGIGRFVLVGHSAGGLVALQYAGDHPERVAGLLLADPAGDARKVPLELMEPFLAGLASDAYAQTMEQYFGFLLAASDAAVRERVMADLWASPKETVVRSFLAYCQYDPLPPLHRYSGPKLSVITAANDAPFGLHNLSANLPYITFTGTGHWLQLDKPIEFNRILDEFLARVESGEAPHGREYES
jgi:pimeloyl-ACP methyl ester carboxylesterase